MIRLMLEPVNFLILDEPTNHLDMQSKEILKNALNNFTGTVLVVSHDRDFLDGLVTCVYEFRNKKAKQYLGGIFDFLYRKKMESLKELEQQKAKPGKTSGNKAAAKTANNLTFEEQKEINRNIARLEKKVQNTEKAISDTEKQIEEMDKALSSTDGISDDTVFSNYEKTKHKLEQLMYEWELVQEELETWLAKKTW